MFELARKSMFLQNLYIAIATFLHPSISHQMSKIEMLKKAFHLVTMECLEGDYFEFGVYEGASILAAAKSWRVLNAKHSKAFSRINYVRNFYGFDSFEEGFKYSGEKDNHPFFTEGSFSNSYEKCRQRLQKYTEIRLIKGIFEETIRGKRGIDEFPDRKCAVLLIDCDLYHPALDALIFMYSILQIGTIVILDDAFCYHGDPTKGVHGAWQEFLTLHTNIKAREYMRYGTASTSYIIYDI